MFSGKLRLSEDEEDFIGDLESSRSNLSNIFGVSVSQGQQQNEDSSLKYVPPKQTKFVEDTAKTEKATTWSIQVAKVVTAFKLVNQENVSQGKIGLAVLKSKDDQYKLILYRTKSKVLSTLTMNENTKVFLKNSYFQFSDELQIFWSILFENEDFNEVFDLMKNIVKIEENTEQDSLKVGAHADEAGSIENKKNSLMTESDIARERKPSDERTIETKAQILSRMAKMGKPLPRLAATTTDFSDSSDTEVKTKLPPKPIAVPRKPKSQQIATISSSNGQLASIMTSISPYNPNINVEAQYLNMLLTENRTQNTEVRINMSKLETKIEKVLDKIESIDSRGLRDTNKCKDDEILELEEKVLVLKRENRTLKIKIKDLEASISSTANESKDDSDVDEFCNSFEMFNINKNDYETSHDLLKELIRKYDSHCLLLNSSLDDYKRSSEDFKVELQSLKKQKIEEISELTRETTRLTAIIGDIETKLKELRAENKELVAQKDQHELATEKELDNVLKDVMNNLYQNLVTKFEAEKSFSSMEILRICGSAIKQETKNVIKNKNCN